MTYDDIRSEIKTGDLIAIKKKSGLFPLAIRLVTNSPYTHTGIAVWVGEKLFLAQTNSGGCNLVPLSQESNVDFDVFDCPVDREAVEAIIWDMLGSRIPYGYIDLIKIFGLLTFGIPLPKENTKDLVCSALSAIIYQKAGWVPKGLPSIPWPGAVVDALTGLKKFEVKKK